MSKFNYPMLKILPIIITFVIAGAGGFFGGMQYQKTRPSSTRQNFGGQNLTQEQRDQMREQFAGGQGGFAGGRGGVRADGGSMTTGEIIAKDNESITVKLQDGGSKIVFYSSSTVVGKFEQGIVDDLALGDNVFVSGKINDDGSLTAQNIQIRPVLSAP